MSQSVFISRNASRMLVPTGYAGHFPGRWSAKSWITTFTALLFLAGVSFASPALGATSAGKTNLDYHHTSDGGLTAAQLDDNPLPEIIMAWVAGTNGGGEDDLRYKVAFNVSDFTVIDWSAAVYHQFNDHGLLGASTDGLGVTVGDVNRNGTPDILVLAVDDPDGENQLFLNYGWDLDPATGAPTGGWSHRVVPYEAGRFHIGSYTEGAGASLVHVNDNDVLDLVFAYSDAPSGENPLLYYVLFDIGTDGVHDYISNKFTIDISDGGGTVGGVGLEVGNFDDDNRPDMMVGIVDIDEVVNHPSDSSHANRVRYIVSWDMNTDGTMPATGGTVDLGDAPPDRSAGLGIAAAREDDHLPYEMLFTVFEDNVDWAWNGSSYQVIGDQNDVAYFYMFDNHLEYWQRGAFRDTDTDHPVRLVRHMGRLVAVTAVSRAGGGNDLVYNVLDDGERWNTDDFTAFEFPSADSDLSVSSRHASTDFTYAYSTLGRGVDFFQVVSDGLHLYTVRHVRNQGLLIDRFVLDETDLTFAPFPDVRYRRSGLKCDTDYSDTYDFRDPSDVPFVEPTTVLTALNDPAEDPNAGFAYARLVGFDAEIMPTALPEEQRWLFTKTYQDGSIYTYSVRRAQEDACIDTDADGSDDLVTITGLFDPRDRTLTYYDDSDTLQSATLVGRETGRITVPGAGVTGVDACTFDRDPALLLYANQQTCDNQRVKTGQRLIMAARTGCNNGEIIVLDFPVSADGTFDHTEADFDNATPGFTEPACGESYDHIVNGRLPDGGADDVSVAGPELYESVDGYVYLSFVNTAGQSFARLWDPFSNAWVKDGDAAAGGVKGGSGWVSGRPYLRLVMGPKPVIADYAPAMAEYGAFERNQDGSLTGVMRRALALTDGRKTRYRPGETVGSLQTDFMGQVLIDLTLLGYIEGAPPVPREILTVDNENYHGATSVAFTKATTSTQNYSQGQDWGFNFTSEGFIHSFAWLLETSYSFLKEKAASNAHTSVFDVAKNLDGGWDATRFRWEPVNRGSAFVRAKKADVFALTLEGSDALMGYRTVPLDESEEEYIIPFKINPRYVKNGTLDGYVDSDKDPDWAHLDEGAGEKGSYYRMDELGAVERSIERTAARIDAHYSEQDTNAFADVPAEDRISQRSFCNEYQWLPDGSFSKTWSFANVFSESQGGSFEFLGMAGGHFELSVLATDFAEFQVMAGAHVNESFEKSEESEEAFELSVVNDLNSGNTGGSVDSYKWRSCYLYRNGDHFRDFYDRVVDPDWLESSDHYAEQLREARGRNNAAWRIRHFVTFVSRQYDAVTETDGGGGGDSGTYTCTRNDDGSYTCVPQ